MRKLNKTKKDVVYNLNKTVKPVVNKG